VKLRAYRVSRFGSDFRESLNNITTYHVIHDHKAINFGNNFVI